MITCDTMDTEASIQQTNEPAGDGCCKTRGVARRIGTNRGSRAQRILNRYGDTPLGMAESALELARTSRQLDYHDFAFSTKASNPKVRIAAYRLLGPRWNELNAE